MLVSTKMITGFNTDVPYEGHVYHVQTEDRGKDNPFLESLVYIGGTIIAKKRTPYTGSLNEDDGQGALASLLKRQHQVIIAAIRAGRIEELIQHSLKQTSKENQANGEIASPLAEVLLDPSDPIELPRHAAAISDLSQTQRRTNGTAVPVEPAGNASSQPLWPSVRSAGGLKVSSPPSPSRGNTAGLNLDQVLEDYVKRGAGQAKLDVKVLTPEVFTAGTGIGLRVQVMHDTKPDFDATVTVKIIGTAFRPQVFIGRVGRDGVANFSLTLPSFNTGTAAIVIEAQSGTGRGELKKLIRRT